MLAEGRFQGWIQGDVSWLSLNSRVRGSCHLPSRGHTGDPVGFPHCSLNILCLSPRFDLLGNPLGNYSNWELGVPFCKFFLRARLGFPAHTLPCKIPGPRPLTFVRCSPLPLASCSLNTEGQSKPNDSKGKGGAILGNVHCK